MTSFGEGCARAEYPGVYARVTEALQWIDESTGGILMKDAGRNRHPKARKELDSVIVKE